jgi:hypothetical protein
MRNGSTYQFPDQLAATRGLVESIAGSPPPDLTQAQTATYSGGGADFEGSVDFGPINGNVSNVKVLGTEKNLLTKAFTIDLTLSSSYGGGVNIWIANASGSHEETTQVRLTFSANGQPIRAAFETEGADRAELTFANTPANADVTRGIAGNVQAFGLGSGNVVESTATLDLTNAGNRVFAPILGQALLSGSSQDLSNALVAIAPHSMNTTTRYTVQTTAGPGFDAKIQLLFGIGIGADAESSSENATLNEAAYEPPGLPVDFPWLTCTG